MNSPAENKQKVTSPKEKQRGRLSEQTQSPGSKRKGKPKSQEPEKRSESKNQPKNIESKEESGAKFDFDNSEYFLPSPQTQKNKLIAIPIDADDNLQSKQISLNCCQKLFKCFGGNKSLQPEIKYLNDQNKYILRLYNARKAEKSKFLANDPNFIEMSAFKKIVILFSKIIQIIGNILGIIILFFFYSITRADNI